MSGLLLGFLALLYRLQNLVVIDDSPVLLQSYCGVRIDSPILFPLCTRLPPNLLEEQSSEVRIRHSPGPMRHAPLGWGGALRICTRVSWSASRASSRSWRMRPTNSSSTAELPFSSIHSFIWNRLPSSASARFSKPSSVLLGCTWTDPWSSRGGATKRQSTTRPQPFGTNRWRNPSGHPAGS